MKSVYNLYLTFFEAFTLSLCLACCFFFCVLASDHFFQFMLQIKLKCAIKLMSYRKAVRKKIEKQEKNTLKSKLCHSIDFHFKSI